MVEQLATIEEMDVDLDIDLAMVREEEEEAQERMEEIMRENELSTEMLKDELRAKTEGDYQLHKVGSRCR